MRYYGWINLKSGPRYVSVVKIDGRNAYVFNKMFRKWVQNNDKLNVMTDTTSWDEISEDTALEMIRQLSGDDTLTLE